MVSALVSDANLIIPFLLAQIDRTNFTELVNTCRLASRFEEEDPVWNEVSIPSIIQWATEEAEQFSNRKKNEKPRRTKKKS